MRSLLSLCVIGVVCLLLASVPLAEENRGTSDQAISPGTTPTALMSSAGKSNRSLFAALKVGDTWQNIRHFRPQK